MIYTNRCLDIVMVDNEKRLETVVLHDRYKTIGVEPNINEKIEYLKPGAHKLLTIKRDPNNKAKLSLSQETTNDVFLIIDLYEYKVFRKNAKLYIPEEFKERVEIYRKYTLFNKSKSCYWNSFIIKLNTDKSDKLIYLKYIDTAGKIRYITIETEDMIIKNVGEKEFIKIAQSLDMEYSDIEAQTLTLVR